MYNNYCILFSVQECCTVGRCCQVLETCSAVPGLQASSHSNSVLSPEDLVMPGQYPVRVLWEQPRVSAQFLKPCSYHTGG